MKFLNFYTDLFEAREIADEKFDFIAKKMGDWLFDEIIENKDKINLIPRLEDFKTFLRMRTTNKARTADDIIEGLAYMDEFLNRISKGESSKYIKDVQSSFPILRYKIQNWNKLDKDPNLEKTKSSRGRPIGSKNKPKDLPQQMKSTPPEQSPIAQPPQPEIKKRGRKSIDDGLTAMERMKYKKEGPEAIQNLEVKAKEIDSEITTMIKKVQRLIKDIEKRKNFFGLEE